MSETASAKKPSEPSINQETTLPSSSEQNIKQVDNLNIRSYSLSQIMGGKDEKKQTTRPVQRSVFTDLLEDCDRLSLFSDSGVSDVSHATDSTINSVVDTGIHPGSNSSPSLGMRKNYSTNDIPNVKHHNALSTPTQQKLPNFMLWNWLRHQKYGAPDNVQQTSVISEKTNFVDTNSIAAQVKSKYSFKMRDLNALVPNEW